MVGNTSQPGGEPRPTNQNTGTQADGDTVATRDIPKESINPYIPRFIARAPWYLNATPGLQHQRVHEEQKSVLEAPVLRGVRSHVAIKYRKNACENCGAVTHDAKSCVERPRKKGAKYTNSNICPDEYIIQNTAVGYDAVRDRWAGFDASTHQLLVEAHKDVEEEQHRRKMQKLANELESQASPTDDNSIELKKPEFIDSDTTFDTTDDRTRTTARNLRIREDTAKYLINLDVDSAFYDPKSRSLRDDPLLGMENSGLHTFRGDNQLFTSGDASKPKEIEQFAWEAQRKGAAVSFMAQPTELEFMFKTDSIKRQKEKEAQRKALIERFGGAEYIDTSDTTNIEQPMGKLPPLSSSNIITGILDTSVYEKEAHLLGHTTVWGSYYDLINKQWGYQCCKCTIKGTECTLNQI